MGAGPDFDVLEALPESLRENFFINGAWRKPLSRQRAELISPVTEECFLRTWAGSSADVDAAVRAARGAFDRGPWPRMLPRERAKYLRTIGSALRRRKDLLNALWTAQVGAPVGFTELLCEFAPALYEYYAQLAEADEFSETVSLPGGRALIVREPVGVTAIISPWNAPLILLSYGVAAALCAGCTVVAKPSPETPLEAQILAQCAEEAGLPAGVLNIVPGAAETGAYLVERKDVDKVAFTGSLNAGKQVAIACAQRLARVSLELGGKSPAIIAEDADLPSALQSIVPFSMPFTGQICFSLSRVLVPKSRSQEVADAYVGAVRQIKVGDPWQRSTQMGPLSMRRQYERTLAYIEKGIREGARLATGGARVQGLERGYYIEPTVFADVDNEMTIAREEIFGPVVSLITYDGDEDAVRIANQTDYGLSGAIFTADPQRGLAMARRLRSGNVTVNGMRVEPSVPFGGFKQSGIGRAGGAEGLRAYQEVKAVYLNA
jgi:acyl-CoA reductase-like NAD-dependent aldehyde dehydrogenase